ncbi:MAG: hypothetical protein KDN22_15850 [Verrucomicrobiae bacterium]|nr:hypothetical protein [Verrucomicrobiae bacterium]
MSARPKIIKNIRNRVAIRIRINVGIAESDPEYVLGSRELRLPGTLSLFMPVSVRVWQWRIQDPF